MPPLTTAQQHILDILQKSNKHLSAADIFSLAKKRQPRIGVATVYRALKHLTQIAAIEKHSFDRRETLYEIRPTVHHDHLICEKCGIIIEFENDTIESLQTEIARAHGFRLTHHELDLFGLCPACL